MIISSMAKFRLALTIPLFFAMAGCTMKPDSQRLKDELFAAARIGHRGLLKHLLAEGINPLWTDHAGNNALVIAGLNKQWSTVNFLLDAKFPLMARDSVGNTLLHTAAYQGNIAEIEYLIKRGIPVDVRNLRHSTPLHLATDNNQLSAVKFLIDRGANIDAQNEAKETSLYVAAWKGNLEIYKFLLKSHAKKDLRPLHSESIEKYLEESGHPDLKLAFAGATRSIN
jgi:ankyrin repeat protein